MAEFETHLYVANFKDKELRRHIPSTARDGGDGQEGVAAYLKVSVEEVEVHHEKWSQLASTSEV